MVCKLLLSLQTTKPLLFLCFLFYSFSSLIASSLICRVLFTYTFSSIRCNLVYSSSSLMSSSWLVELILFHIVIDTMFSVVVVVFCCSCCCCTIISISSPSLTCKASLHFTCSWLHFAVFPFIHLPVLLPLSDLLTLFILHINSILLFSIYLLFFS